jgi:hypothetical protein
MNGFQKNALIYPEGPGFPEIPLIKKALRTSVVFSLSGNKGKAASRTKGGGNGRETLATGLT